jgi:hypothetical protein
MNMSANDRLFSVIRRERFFILRDFAQTALFAGMLIATAVAML